jgi:hypothetical protein
MITEQTLLESGYRKHRYQEGMCGDAVYEKIAYGQRADRDDLHVRMDKLYSVHAFLWRMPDGGGGVIRRVEFEARLYLPEGNKLVGSTGFTLKVHAADVATIPEIEAFYARAFGVLDCVPDLHNND